MLVAFHLVEITPQPCDDILRLVCQFRDTRHRRLELAVDVCRFFQLTMHDPQAVHHRILLAVQAFQTVVGNLDQLLGIAKSTALLLQLLIFTGNQLGRLDLRLLEPPQFVLFVLTITLGQQGRPLVKQGKDLTKNPADHLSPVHEIPVLIKNVQVKIFL